MEIDAKAPEGNAVFIMGAVRRLLADAGRADEIPGVTLRMKSGNYENLCKVAEEVTYGSITVVNRGEDHD